VLEHGWAYGRTGTALRGKRLLSLISTGGGASAYRHEGYNRFTLRELLAPIEQTAFLCGMDYLPPYAIQGTHRLDEAGVAREAGRYRLLLAALRDDRLDLSTAPEGELLNPLVDALEAEEVAA
jgi:glutathione-regulated potassium-efflux system ancillary protein KefG